MIQKWTQTLTAFLLLSFSVSCVEKKEDKNTLLAALLYLAANQIKVNSATDLVNESAEDYNDNNWGLITPQTLNRFVSNWPANKPSHITGNLIILQTDEANRVAGGAASPFVAENPGHGVYVYLLDDYRPASLPSGGFRFNQTRDTGLFSNSVRYQANGQFVDDWLKTFGINLSKDLVVFAVGTGNGISGGAYPAKAVGAGAVQDITRGVYWLRYWGADIKNLAILNGNLNKKATGAGIPLSASRSGINLERNGGFSVKQLRVDNTVLTLGLEDIYEIAKTGGNANLSGLTAKQQIIDARPATQYNGTADGLNVARNALVTNPTNSAYITTSYQSSGAPSASAGNQTFVPFEGSIKSSKTFPWSDLLKDNADGYEYLDKAALKTLFNTTRAVYTPGTTIVSQCRTNFEAQVNGFASLNILGYPTVYYDGSLVEWTALVAGHGTSAVNQVPSDFKWRTDIGDVSTKLWYNEPTHVVRPNVNLTATTTKKFIQEDKAYKY
ncbi:sulfurtransferase [Leptospira bandrabouensis]|uniref:Sulfurtransferase n=1 Tax=Leptospira bandrabouensis TaxID=2484903 RepID=A0A6H3NYC0_9LEPT|nr:sulfurtransferase [Leptospira bandrabouensis]MCG6153470.1 sulfurtransferase [Leptospira bandrabouensis]TGN05963.1 sulfurtransferase [Leptospira bandrabouensis]TGN16296.1 sulfurtransferase [Leptospira bandrabouensis]